MRTSRMIGECLSDFSATTCPSRSISRFTAHREKKREIVVLDPKVGALRGYPERPLHEP